MSTAQRSFWLSALILLALFAASPALLIKILYFSNEIYLGVTEAFRRQADSGVSETQEIRFVGDVMLARHVETLLKKEGSDYPYRLLESGTDTVWVGNFEATVPDTHTHTKDFTFAFSVDKTHLPSLHTFGFRYLSLANNHSYDFGPEVYDETVKNLEDFTRFGHPYTVSENSVAYIPLEDTQVGLLALNAINSNPDHDTLTEVLAQMQRESDHQVVYIHWGEEYETTHNAKQAALAEFLIDEGVDAVIGHHPHVVQDIVIYKDKPIFYSLGNFIFDQYFDDAVQQGLIVKLSLHKDDLQFKLVPVTSIGNVAMPREMSETEKNAFFIDLAARSDTTFTQALETGHITLRE